jgi:hypothetical protein
MLDLFDLIVDQFPNLVGEPSTDSGGWVNFIRDSFNASPPLCEYLDRYRAWYLDTQGNETGLMGLARRAPNCAPRLDGKTPSGGSWPPPGDPGLTIIEAP